jgi:hypothetical protein
VYADADLTYNFREGLKLLTAIGVGVTCGVGFVVWSWINHSFANIFYLKFTLFLLYAATVIGSLGITLFQPIS